MTIEFIFQNYHMIIVVPLSGISLVNLLEGSILGFLDGITNVHPIGDSGLKAENAGVPDVLGQVALNIYIEDM